MINPETRVTVDLKIRRGIKTLCIVYLKPISNARPIVGDFTPARDEGVFKAYGSQYEQMLKP